MLFGYELPEAKVGTVVATVLLAGVILGFCACYLAIQGKLYRNGGKFWYHIKIFIYEALGAKQNAMQKFFESKIIGIFKQGLSI